MLGCKICNEDIPGKVCSHLSLELNNSRSTLQNFFNEITSKGEHCMCLYVTRNNKILATSRINGVDIENAPEVTEFTIGKGTYNKLFMMMTNMNFDSQLDSKLSVV